MDIERDGAMKAEERSRRRRPLRVVVVLILVLVALAAAGAATVAVATLGVRGELEEGRRSLDRGRRALSDGRLTDATHTFEEALRAFQAADGESNSGLSTVGRYLPVLGRTLDVTAALADAGDHTARAGLAMSAAIERLPGGLNALAPAEGALPIEALASLAEPLEKARAETALAVDAVRSSPAGTLPGPVADARHQALERIEEAEHALESWSALALGVPEFAGAEGPRRYLFFAENPAELRGTGGLWGAFAILRIEEGRLSFSSFRPIQSLRNLPPDEAPAPNPDYRRNYERWGAPGYWLSINMTPDFPSAARAALGTWSAIGGERMDGVLSADPFTLKHLLDVTGGVHLSRPRIVVTSKNVVPLLSNKAFALFPDPRIRKSLLGQVSLAVFDRFLNLEGRVVPRLRAIGRSVADGHLKIYTIDEAMQGALAQAGLDNGLRADGAADLLAVVVNSGSGGKVDFFAERTVDHSVTLHPGSDSTAVTVTTIENGAPTTGQPRYVIGPHIGRAGDNIPLISVFCGSRCRLVGAERDGDRISMFTGSELGYRYYQDYFTIPSEATRVLTVRTETPESWRGDSTSGTYRLAVLGQTTIRPTRGTVRIAAPPGMHFTDVSEGFHVRNDVATWDGVLQRGFTLEVSFEAASLPVRVWRALRDLF